jgi:hypothetical protein
MALVNMISVFDAYIGRLLRGLLKTKPEILNASNRQLTYAQLSEFDTLDSARDFILEAEVDSILRSSHSEHFEWLENKLSMPLRKDLPSWPVFIEITERRNLFVHTDGVVNAQYLNICRRNKCDLKKDVTIGSRLIVDQSYFKCAYDCLIEIGVKLGQVVWRKILASDIKSADEYLISVCYDMLIIREYAIAEKLLVFAVYTLPRHFSEENNLIYKINLAIAYKWQGKEGDCIDLLNKIDFSALSDKFKLAECVLKGEFEQAGIFVRKIGSSSTPSKMDYREWPLFNKFRKSEEFKDAYKDVFGEPFQEVHVTSKKKDEPPIDD